MVRVGDKLVTLYMQLHMMNGGKEMGRGSEGYIVEVLEQQL